MAPRRRRAPGPQVASESVVIVGGAAVGRVVVGCREGVVKRQVFKLGAQQAVLFAGRGAGDERQVALPDQPPLRFKPLLGVGVVLSALRRRVCGVGGAGRSGV